MAIKMSSDSDKLSFIVKDCNETSWQSIADSASLDTANNHHTSASLPQTGNNVEQQAQLSLTNHLTLTSGEWMQFIIMIFRLLPTPLLSEALNERDPLELEAAYLVWE